MRRLNQLLPMINLFLCFIKLNFSTLKSNVVLALPKNYYTFFFAQDVTSITHFTFFISFVEQGKSALFSLVFLLETPLLKNAKLKAFMGSASSAVPWRHTQTNSKVQPFGQKPT